MAEIETSSYIPNDYSLYQPLHQSRDELRLLRLQPQPHGSSASVKCYLIYASLQDPRVPNAYTCLSYCWGSTATTKEISVIKPNKHLPDGTCEGPEYRFNVTANLEAALRHIRSLTARPLIWADAVCINQSDLVERAHQVGMMQRIYSLSMQTLIWLGDADADSDLAVDYAIHIRRILARAEDLDMNQVEGGLHCGRVRGLLRGELAFTKEEVSHPDFIALRHATRRLLARPWFRRVWVLQEVNRSSAVVAICGSKACQWQDIRHLGVLENRVTLWEGSIPWADQHQASVDSAGNDGNATAQDEERTDDLPEIWYFLASECKDDRLPSIGELVFRRGQIQATDPRDQVFALFGISRECQHASTRHLAGFQPNYSKTVVEVYTDFTRAVIEATGNLDILSAVNTFQYDRQRRQGMPSWVPELDQHFNLRRSLSFLGLKGYRTTHGIPKNIEVSGSPNQLLVRGAVIDSIHISEADKPVLQVRRRNEHAARQLFYKSSGDGLSHLWHDVQQQQYKYRLPNNQDLLEAFILTLTCGRDDQRTRTTKHSIHDILSLAADFAAYWRTIEPDFGSLPSRCTFYSSFQELEELSSKGSAMEFGRRIMWTCDARRFLFTSEGRMGLFPRQTVGGDGVIVLFGSNVPWVVRRTAEGGEECYRLIGECYIQGRMDGSVVFDLENGKLSAQFFNLR